MTEIAAEKDHTSSPTTTVITFDVGGRVYKLSRALLESFPDTMLSRLASDTWQPDPTQTIFIDRNGDRFQYCLDYLRDNVISLPLTVSKKAVIIELEYFGIDYDRNKVQSDVDLRSILEAVEERQKSFLDSQGWSSMPVSC